ncbi:J domain-containing protein [Tengunoibacter tsumagoiensis]|uniref:J domain-containing protein n=1 Tax=Tengunoibacter tsumagoiensis TaxID=2014871 RepID=A0A402A399_9CHLR|nr:DnaJ domain-containing protein [Tengunoibacter tsumagoiensis]GCE13638.1 hypothetical protein KTT_34970 [Tengunoibacter tsumagoiensis]
MPKKKEIEDYYTLLGIPTDASTEVIKKAFKRLALRYHPDVYKGSDAEEKTRLLLLAYQTLSDPERRRSYDRSLGQTTTSHGSTATDQGSHAPERPYAFPPLPDHQPAQLDLGSLTYLLSAHEARRLKEDGMLRGAKVPSATDLYYCHRCHHQWQSATKPALCPHCQARDWNEYLLLRCQHCHAVFESEQIRYEIGSLQYGDGALCPPYELFPLCPQCGKSQWCPAEETRLWHIRDRAERIAKWRRRFGLV